MDEPNEIPMFLSSKTDRINEMQRPIHCSHSSSIAHKFRYWMLLKTENSITITTTHHHTYTRALLPVVVIEVVATASTIIATLSKPINSYYDMKEDEEEMV